MFRPVPEGHVRYTYRQARVELFVLGGYSALFFFCYRPCLRCRPLLLILSLLVMIAVLKGVSINCCHYTSDVGITEASPFDMGSSNTFVLQRQGLQQVVFILPICGAFWRSTCVEAVPKAVHYMQAVVEILSTIFLVPLIL